MQTQPREAGEWANEDAESQLSARRRGRVDKAGRLNQTLLGATGQAFGGSCALRRAATRLHRRSTYMAAEQQTHAIICSAARPPASCVSTWTSFSG